MENWTQLTGNHYVANDVKAGRYTTCGDCGSIVPISKHDQHTNFHKTFSHRRNDGMSNVAWCDPGNHAFKAGSPGSVDYTASVRDENGSRVTQTMDACADHSPFRSEEEKQLKAIEGTLIKEYPTGA